MKCEICGKGVLDGVTLYRQNELGVKGIWRCTEHNQQPVDKEVQELVDIIEAQ